MTDRRMKTLVLVAGLVVLAGVALWLAAGSRPAAPEQRQQAARDLLSGVHVSATVAAASFVATSAFGDLGGHGGPIFVRVRILEEVHLDVRVETTRSIAFADPPRLCFVGPFSAPDDAGLSDPCWGEPDLGSLISAQLPSDPSGHPWLPARQSIDFAATLHRGNVRCDYPPGAWELQVVADPVIDGSGVGPIDLPDVSVAVPYSAADVLRYLKTDTTRYCGLVSAVYLEQGEPPVQSP